MLGLAQFVLSSISCLQAACKLISILFAVVSCQQAQFAPGQPLTEPAPSAFPTKLLAHYAALDKRFDCDFNQQNMCGFAFNTSVWSFHQSLKELAEQFSRAAEAAANAIHNNSKGVISGTVAGPKITTMDSIVVNYFPCAIDRPDPTLRGNRSHPVSQLSSSMELSIPWPQFASFIIPLDATQEPDQQRPHHRRHSLIPRSPEQRPLLLLACVHLNLRFPSNVSSHVQLRFISVLQEFTLSCQTTATPLSAQQQQQQQLSGIHLDQSLFTKSTPTDPKRGLSVVPCESWVELTVPVHFHSTDFAADTAAPQQNATDSKLAAQPLAVFTSNGQSWIARAIPTTFRLGTTAGVCVDDFRLRPWAHKSDTVSAENTCLRSLVWRDTVTNEKQMLLIDSHGVPVEPAETNNPSTLVLRLHPTVNATWNTRGMQWLRRFTGSMVLAISTTLLFLLLVLAISVSIVLALGRPAGGSVPKGRPRRRSLPVDSSQSHDSASLLSESSSDKFPLEHPAQHAAELESGSILCNESLFHNSNGTYQSNRDTHSESSDIPLDSVTNTSAVQLMRNWYFYHRRGQRARQKQRIGRPQVSSSKSRIRQSPIVLSPDPACRQMMLRAKQRVPALRAIGGNPANRRSLVFCTDSNNQLILLPEDSVDHPLDSIPELLPGHSRANQEACSAAMAGNAQRAVPREWLPPAGSLTPSTIARSELSAGNTDERNSISD